MLFNSSRNENWEEPIIHKQKKTNIKVDESIFPYYRIYTLSTGKIIYQLSSGVIKFKQNRFEECELDELIDVMTMIKEEIK